MTSCFVSTSKTLSVIVLLGLGLAACSPTLKDPPGAETIRICDDNGCAVRPKGYAAYEPESALPNEDTAKIAGLEALAAKDPRAAYDLALRFFRGDGVRQDSYRSVKWMRDAAERGEINAQKALGRLYLTGMGEMGADPGEAEKWLSITAGRGDREAQTLLQEAIAARQSVQAQYQWDRRWRPIFQNYWASTYSYLWYWNLGAWYLY